MAAVDSVRGVYRSIQQSGVGSEMVQKGEALRTHVLWACYATGVRSMRTAEYDLALSFHTTVCDIAMRSSVQAWETREYHLLAQYTYWHHAPLEFGLKQDRRLCIRASCEDLE